MFDKVVFSIQFAMHSFVVKKPALFWPDTRLKSQKFPASYKRRQTRIGDDLRVNINTVTPQNCPILRVPTVPYTLSVLRVPIRVLKNTLSVLSELKFP